MRYYETTFIARQDLAQNQVENLEKHFTKLLKELGGEVKFIENWGLRPLAYKINKNKKGHYVFMSLYTTPEAISELERQMRLHEDVLRYLTVRIDEETPTPTPMLKDRLRDDQKASSFDTERDYKKEDRSRGSEEKSPIKDAENQEKIA